MKILATLGILAKSFFITFFLTGKKEYREMINGKSSDSKLIGTEDFYN